MSLTEATYQSTIAVKPDTSKFSTEVGRQEFSPDYLERYTQVFSAMSQVALFNNINAAEPDECPGKKVEGSMVVSEEKPHSGWLSSVAKIFTGHDVCAGEGNDSRQCQYDMVAEYLAKNNVNVGIG